MNHVTKLANGDSSYMRASSGAPCVAFVGVR